MGALLRLMFWGCTLALFVWFGTSVSLGGRSLFDHLTRIWATEETQDLVEGVQDTSGPALDRLRRAVEAAKEDPPNSVDAGSPDADGPDASPPNSSGASASPAKPTSTKSSPTTSRPKPATPRRTQNPAQSPQPAPSLSP